MLTIYLKELKGYFRSFLGWLFMAVLLFFLGIYFTYYNLSGGTPYLAYTISSVLLFVLLMVPLLTMKIWAEEYRRKTDQLLFTAPVRTGEVLFGKFLAIETIFVLVLAVLFCYMLVLSRYGTIPFGENILSLFAFFLFGTACIAIGFFISACTGHMVIAAVISYVVLIACTFMPNITGIFSATGNAGTKMINQIFDIASHLNGMMNGILDLVAVLYYVSVTGLMLFFTWMVIRGRRKALFYDLKTSCHTIGEILVVLLAVAFLNLVAAGMPATVTQYDITKEQMYSLTDETKKLVDGLQEQITIYVLADRDNADQAVDTMLGRYEAESALISVSYKDPDEYPAFSQFYTTEELEENSLIIVGENRHKVIPYSDCYETAYTMDNTTYEYYETVTGFDGEGQITAGIAYVTSEDIPVLYEIAGHEEYALPDPLVSRIEKMNMELQSINLMQYDEVPENTAAILICGPVTDLSQDDMAKIRAYLENGGNALIFTAFSTEDMSRYESLLPEYGITVTEGVVFEADSYYYKELPYYLMPVVLDEELTKDLYDNQRLLLLAQCRGLTIAGDYDEDHITVTPLMMTSDQAYSKVDVASMETMERENGDIDGPFCLAALAEKELENGALSKVIAVGTEYIVDSDLNDYTSDANYQFLLNCITTLAAVSRENSISIPAKSYQLSMILVSSGTGNIFAAVIVFVIPAGLLLAGIIMVFVRRKKHGGRRKA